jgi:hypothetical protein
MSELLRACALCHVLLRALFEMEERDGRTERSGAGREGRAERTGTGRKSGAAWNGTGRDGTGRDGTGRDGTGRKSGADGTGRDGTGRDAKGERDGGTERRHGTRPNPLRLDAPIPRQRALPYITGAVA